MAYTKEQREAKSKTKPQTKAIVEPKVETVVEPQVEVVVEPQVEVVSTVKNQNEVKISKPKYKINSNTKLLVKSCICGELIFVNTNTHDKVTWSEYGSVQELSLEDIRNIRSQQNAFFENNWFSIIGVIDYNYDDDIDMDIESVYRALNLERYYSEKNYIKDIDALFTMDISELRALLPTLSASIQEVVIVRANEKIKDGKLNSIQHVKVIEEALHCQLTY